MTDSKLKVAIAQIAPIWLDKEATTEKIVNYIEEAGKQGCELLVFGEGLLPGYPFWLSLTHASEFNSKVQKEIHAHYAANAVQIENGDLIDICQAAKRQQVAIYLGIIERPIDRGGHSLYCSLVFIDADGDIRSVHRKLQPTYEERLSWSPGDGHGLRVHQLKQFAAGGLNCWENWMPLARTALYGMGENLHIAVWPGTDVNTKDITRFIAKESRSFVISASSLLRVSDIPTDMPHRDLVIKSATATIANGGSCIASPDGSWVIEPVVDHEGLIKATIDYKSVLEERQNFDPSGHYSRPDILKLSVNRGRQSVIEISDD